MSPMHRDKLTRIIEILTIVGLSGGIVGGGTAWAWAAIITPKIKEEIKVSLDKHEEAQTKQFERMEQLIVDVRDRTMRIEGKLQK